jgi:hypothetical protein
MTAGCRGPRTRTPRVEALACEARLPSPGPVATGRLTSSMVSPSARLAARPRLQATAATQKGADECGHLLRREGASSHALTPDVSAFESSRRLDPSHSKTTGAPGTLEPTRAPPRPSFVTASAAKAARPRQSTQSPPRDRVVRVRECAATPSTRRHAGTPLVADGASTDAGDQDWPSRLAFGSRHGHRGHLVERPSLVRVA